MSHPFHEHLQRAGFANPQFLHGTLILEDRKLASLRKIANALPKEMRVLDAQEADLFSLAYGQSVLTPDHRTAIKAAVTLLNQGASGLKLAYCESPLGGEKIGQACYLVAHGSLQDREALRKILRRG